VLAEDHRGADGKRDADDAQARMDRSFQTNPAFSGSETCMSGRGALR
jgi:hypothetical protein